MQSVLDWAELVDNFDKQNKTEDFSAMLEGHLDNVAMYDPKIGERYRVSTIDTTDNNLYAVLPNGYKVQLSIAEEYYLLCNILGISQEKLNNKSFLDTVYHNADAISQIFDKNVYEVVIQDKLKDSLQGSITTAFTNDIREEFFRQLKAEDKVYNCRITGKNGGGLIGNISGVQVFIPGSHASHTRVTDFETYVGTDLKVMIDSYLKESDIFVASNKKYINKILPTLLDNLDMDSLHTGRITGISSYGVFVDFGECFTALFHNSDMSGDIKERYTNGTLSINDEISFYIKSIKDNRIVCSSKNPTEIREENQRLSEELTNEIVSGQVVKLLKSGFLVELHDNLKGFLPFKEANKTNPKMKEGDVVFLLVESVDTETQKIYLKSK